jgi:hypothetical protein
MFALCELHSKDKNDKRHSQDNQDKEVVQTKYREQKENPQWCHGVLFTKLPTEPCALGSTQPLKMSTRILLGVKTAGA